MSSFKRATRSQARLRLALMGPAGSGKTYTALTLATYLVPAGKVALIDTERASSSKYAPGPGKKADPAAGVFEFDSSLLAAPFHPRRYLAAMKEAEEAGYDVLIIDSLSHAWIGQGGGLTLHDEAVSRQKVKNTYTAWAEVTPHHMALVEGLLQSPLHVIVTMRTKEAHVQEKDAAGITRVRKIGMEPLMRDGIEYEFDVAADLDLDNTLVVGKTRCKALKGVVVKEPGKPLADTLRAWLDDGAPREVQALPSPDPPPPPPNGHSVAELVARDEDRLVREGACEAGALRAYLRGALGQGWAQAPRKDVGRHVQAFAAGDRLDDQGEEGSP